MSKRGRGPAVRMAAVCVASCTSRKLRSIGPSSPHRGLRPQARRAMWASTRAQVIAAALHEGPAARRLLGADELAPLMRAWIAALVLSGEG